MWGLREDSQMQARKKPWQDTEVSQILGLSGLQNWEKINFCFLRHSIYGIFFFMAARAD